MSRQVSPVLSDSFDEVLNAVQETARGRWFLEEYASRRKAEDTAAILAAIVKLESVMSKAPNYPAEQVDQSVLHKARSAIARAKSQIKDMAADTTPLSDEAQLFGKLAEKARSAIAQGTSIGESSDILGKSVDVALRLVNELDNSLGVPLAQKKTTDTKFFQQDSDVFAPAPNANLKSAKSNAPIASSTATPVSPLSAVNSSAEKPVAVDGVTRGAKLTIHRSTTPRPENNAEMDAQDEIQVPSEPAVTENVAPEQPANKPEQRIVIIRKKYGEQMDVPMLDNADRVTAA